MMMVLTVHYPNIPFYSILFYLVTAQKVLSGDGTVASWCKGTLDRGLSNEA